MGGSPGRQRRAENQDHLSQPAADHGITSGKAMTHAQGLGRPIISDATSTMQAGGENFGLSDASDRSSGEI